MASRVWASRVSTGMPMGVAGASFGVEGGEEIVGFGGEIEAAWMVSW